MTKHDFKPGDRFEAVEIKKKKQTLPVGTKGTIISIYPPSPELLLIMTDEPIKAPIGNKKGTKIVGYKESRDFCICAEEIKKI